MKTDASKAIVNMVAESIDGQPRRAPATSLSEVAHGAQRREPGLRVAPRRFREAAVLPTDAAKKLEAFVEGRTTGPVFLGSDVRISMRHAQRRLSQWFAKAQITGRSAHSFRHTFAGNAARAHGRPAPRPGRGESRQHRQHDARSATTAGETSSVRPMKLVIPLPLLLSLAPAFAQNPPETDAKALDELLVKVRAVDLGNEEQVRELKELISSSRKTWRHTRIESEVSAQLTPMGLGAVVFCQGAQAVALEIYSYGADLWDGVV